MTRQHSSLHPYLHVHRQRTKKSALPFTCVPTSARATAPHARRQHGASRHPCPQRCAQAHAATHAQTARRAPWRAHQCVVLCSVNFVRGEKNAHAPPSEKKQSERTSHCSLRIHRPHRWGPALLSTATARAADVRQRARSHARMNGPSGAAAQRMQYPSQTKNPAWKQCVSSTNTLNAESPTKAHPQCPCVPLARYIDKSRFTECG